MSKPNQIELLPCPFCGSKRIVIQKSEATVKVSETEEFTDVQFCVYCDDCYAHLPKRNYRQEVVKLWNTRNVSPTVRILNRIKPGSKKSYIGRAFCL